MAQRIIGLDIGSHSVKAMVVQSSLRRLTLTELREHHIPIDATGSPVPGELSASVKAVLAGLEADVLVAGVPGTQVLLRELDLPFSDDKNVAQVLPFRLEGLLPRPIETMVHDWHLLRKTATGAQMLCPAADKQWLEQWLKEVRGGGAEPRQLTLSMLAAENLFAHLDAPPQTTVALVDIGHRSTQLSLVKDGRIEGVRALSRGGHQVTQAIARGLSLPYPDAEHLKHTALRLDGHAASEVSNEDVTVLKRAMPDVDSDLSEADRVRIERAALTALEPLLRELGMTLDAMVRPGDVIDRIILTGGTSRIPGIEAMLEDATGLPVERPAPKGPLWGELVHDRRLLELGLPSVALALEHVADTGGHRVNLRRGELGGFSDFSAITARAGWIAAFVGILLAIFIARKFLRISTLEGHEQILAEKLDEQSLKLLGEAQDESVAVIDRFRTVRDAVAEGTKTETEQIYPQMTAFRVFYDVTRIQHEVNLQAEPPKPGEDEAFEEDEDGLPRPKAPPATPPPAIPAAEKHQIELTSFAAEVKSPTSAAATVAGSGFDIVTIEKFASKLREHKCFKQVDRQETKKTTNPARPGWTDFTLKIEVTCGAPAETKAAKTEATDKKPADKGEGD
jgi:type IV pilus assembly protein PilM